MPDTICVRKGRTKNSALVHTICLGPKSFGQNSPHQETVKLSGFSGKCPKPTMTILKSFFGMGENVKKNLF